MTFMKPLLTNAAQKPGQDDMAAATGAAQGLLALRFSSPLFRLGTSDLIQQKVSYPTGGPGQRPGVIVMVIDDTVGADIDPQLYRIVVVFNATPDRLDIPVTQAGELVLSPTQASGSDPVVQATGADADSVDVPACTVAVMVQPQG